MDTKITIDNQEHSQADRSYDWAAYYESAYRALKEKNIQMSKTSVCQTVDKVSKEALFFLAKNAEIWYNKVKKNK